MSPTKILVFQNRFLLGGQERQTVNNLRTIDRSRFEPVVACLHLEGEHLADLEAAGIRPVAFDVGRRMLRPNTAWQVARLVHAIRTQGIKLVHAQDVYTNVLGTLAAKAAGIPSIVTRVDLGHHIVGYRRPLVRLASRRADRVLVNALCIRDMCMREGVEPDRIVVVRNGADIDALDAAALREPDPPVPAGCVVCIANMHHPVKGQTDLLMAMREVIRERPDAQVAFVGDGVRRPHLERMASVLGIRERCHFLGFRRDGAAILARAALYVSASYAEGISNAILEAMTMRLPVVATAVGGTPEIVREGVNGHLVPPGAPGAMAGRIVDLLERPPVRRRMGERGRKIVEREFSLAQMRLGYDALYEDLCAVRMPRVVYGAA